ncbi:endonuclease/exonuclease/phosphatase family protein [Gracilimonas sp.]|uniref:endonuclease/exonuclease/phosphatase family protein n=1 Tax=Gracilimonas sp. TaxID=1974203 RepID=UPI0028724106|nr:endonuclease/exonuclease/phosphatase family protein [Gracilimonas sp.]
MKKVALTILVFLCTIGVFAQNASNEYTLVTYNIENLFDADGVAIYDDYRTTDNDGKPLYTKEDVLTKIKNAVRVLKQYNQGKGPDVVAMVELESDFTPWPDLSPDDFLKKYASTTLEQMLGDDFTEDIADLPSELLLLKGMVDSDMWNYEMSVGKSKVGKDGEPETVQKTVTYSRFPIHHGKTEIHHLVRARPILETWINVKGNELVIFNNHWKSGASSWQMEQVRHQNAKVLRARLDELLAENPNLDIVLAGDFNSDYNQSYRYDFEKTAVNDILGSIGDEQKVAKGNTDFVYNLWYDFPVNKRGSDTYQGKWGTLMQIMITSGMYDDEGIQYVDNSFDRGDFGFNTFSTSGEPKRWSSAFTGSGYSDHLPISMKFRLAEESIIYSGFSVNDDEEWKPIEVAYSIPENFISEKEFTSEDPRENPEFYGEYVLATATVTDDYDFVVEGITYDVYTPAFRLNQVLSDVAGTEQKVKFYGRFSQYRGNWQFIIESRDFITIQ